MLLCLDEPEYPLDADPRERRRKWGGRRTARRVSGLKQEVGDQLLAAFGGEGFRVELNAMDRVLLMLHAHDLEVATLMDTGMVGEAGHRQVVHHGGHIQTLRQEIGRAHV